MFFRFLLIVLTLISASLSFGHEGHQHHVPAPQEPTGKSYEIPGVPFQIYAKSEDEEAAALDVRKAIESMVERRSEYRRFDEVLKKNAIQSIVVEDKVTNHEGKEFFLLVARTKNPAQVKLMISASQLKEKNLLGTPAELVPILEREFQWVVSKTETPSKPKTVTSERDLPGAAIQNDIEILKMTAERRIEILRSLFDTYIRTVDDLKSLDNQSYYDGASETLLQPSNKDSTTRFYEIRIREALEKIVSDPTFLKKYPRTVQSLLNGKIWSVSFVNVDQRDWATRTRVVTEEKAIKVGAESRLIQPASILVNVYRKAAQDDLFLGVAGQVPMGALTVDQLAQVIAIEIEVNIFEKSMRGHTVTDEKTEPAK